MKLSIFAFRQNARAKVNTTVGYRIRLYATVRIHWDEKCDMTPFAIAVCHLLNNLKTVFCKQWRSRLCVISSSSMKACSVFADKIDPQVTKYTWIFFSELIICDPSTSWLSVIECSVMENAIGLPSHSQEMHRRVQTLIRCSVLTTTQLAI